MRKLFLLLGTVLFFAAVAPAVTRAQFQAINPDELKMTSDPKAPGADAVFLEFRESDNDAMHDRRYYTRIKVLTEKGKELATVALPYMKSVAEFNIVDVKGRTIHSDGTVVPLAVKSEDLLKMKTEGIQIQQKIFTLPAVEVGSVLEYSFELTYGNREVFEPTWEVQRRYFVRKAHYDFTPINFPGTRNQQAAYLIDKFGNIYDQLVYWWQLPNGVTVAQEPTLGRFSLNVTDIPPIPNEAWAPPLSSTLYKVQFYYTYATSAEDFWAKAAKIWSKDTDEFADPNKVIRDAVAGVVASSDSDLEKAQKLYAAVQGLDNTSFSRQKTESERRELKLKAEKHASDIWTQKSGNRNEIAILYLAMLRAAGLTAYAITVVDRDQGIFDPTYMSVAQLDDTLVILNTGGKEMLLDPGEKMCPFGTVSWRHSQAGGLRQSINGPSRAETPSQVFGANLVKRIGDITVDRQGGIDGTIQISMTGQEALFWRQRALQVDASELNKQFADGLAKLVPDGIEVHVDHLQGLDDPASALIAVVQVKGTLGAATPKRLILPGFFFQSHGGAPFVSEEKRLEPVDIHYPSQVTDQVTYDLPDGSTVEGAPQDAKLSWEGHAMYIIKTRLGSGQITVARALADGFTIAKPEDYQDLRSFYQKVAAADQGQLVLAISPSAKGN